MKINSFDQTAQYCISVTFLVIIGLPLAWDPATIDASARLNTCQAISDSGVFEKYGYDPVDMSDIYTELKQLKYSEIFHLIYSSLQSQNGSDERYEYNNPYTQRLFQITEFFPIRPGTNAMYSSNVESVFLCLLRQKPSNNLVPYYVSKAYNELDHHRFLFMGQNSAYFTYQYHQRIMFAEESAETYGSQTSEFNVELHYLQKRIRYDPGNSFLSNTKSYSMYRKTVELRVIIVILHTK